MDVPQPETPPVLASRVPVPAPMQQATTPTASEWDLESVPVPSLAHSLRSSCGMIQQTNLDLRLLHDKSSSRHGPTCQSKTSKGLGPTPSTATALTTNLREVVMDSASHLLKNAGGPMQYLRLNLEWRR